MQLWVDSEKSIIVIIIRLCRQEYNIIFKKINIAMLSNHLNHLDNHHNQKNNQFF
jgi:hypothetical protein